MQGAEIKDKGSVRKYMTKSEIDEQRSSLHIMTQRLSRCIRIQKRKVLKLIIKGAHESTQLHQEKISVLCLMNWNTTSLILHLPHKINYSKNYFLCKKCGLFFAPITKYS